MFVRVPKYVVAENINRIHLPSRTMKIPARYDLLKQAASDRLLLNWFENAWGKTKNSILDNWESAGLRKRRKSVDENRQRATRTIRQDLGTDRIGSQDGSKDSKNELVDKAKNVAPSLDELAKAKNKAQRQLAEDWDAVKRVNSRTNENLLDNVRERTTSTVDELSKSVNEKADNVIDETTKDIKSKIGKKADDLKERIQKS